MAEQELQEVKTEIREGDRVRYRIGRGFSEGRVLSLAEGKATVELKNGGKQVRNVGSLEKVA